MFVYTSAVAYRMDLSDSLSNSENIFSKVETVKFKDGIWVQRILLNDFEKNDLVMIFIEEAIWLITKCDIWYCLNSEGFDIFHMHASTLDKYVNANFWQKFTKSKFRHKIQG